MTTPLDTLRDEHRVILRAIALLETAVGRLAEGGELPAGWWDALLDWLRGFADRTHHAKEERHLFPALAQAGVPEAGGPVGVMREEHDEGRALVRLMGHAEAEAERLGAARRYIELLRGHIVKENGVLLPIADAVLGPGAEGLARAFASVDAGQEFVPLDRAEAEVERLAAGLEALPSRTATARGRR